MSEICRVALFGHRNVDNICLIEEHLIPIIKNIIRTNTYVEFYIGRSGEFDELSASVIKRVQNEIGKENNELILVLPYIVKDIEYYEKYYDSIIMPIKSHFKSAITKRNEWMAENSEIVIGFVERNTGGAYSALKYAEKLNKTIINLANQTVD